MIRFNEAGRPWQRGTPEGRLEFLQWVAERVVKDNWPDVYVVDVDGNDVPLLEYLDSKRRLTLQEMLDIELEARS
jgi:hypothetical protein